jgi:hypothetical protein
MSIPSYGWRSAELEAELIPFSPDPNYEFNKRLRRAFESMSTFSGVRFCNTGLMDRKLENDRSGCTPKTARTRRTHQEGYVIYSKVLESGG